MPVLTLNFAETVAIGPFNPHIITPDWLFKVGVCRRAGGEGDVGGWFPDLPGAGTAFGLDGYEWDVSLERLVVSTDEPGKDCGGRVAAVIRELFHTPVDAVGNNFVFTAESGAWAGRHAPQLGDKTAEALTALETRWTGRFQEDGAVVEVDLTYPLGDTIVLRLNFDRRTADFKKAVAAAEAFIHDRRRADEFIRKLFGTDVL